MKNVKVKLVQTNMAMVEEDNEDNSDCSVQLV